MDNRSPHDPISAYRATILEIVSLDSQARLLRKQGHPLRALPISLSSISRRVRLFWGRLHLVLP